MVKITWHNEFVPEGMKIKQVYGLVFNEEGKILMRVENRGNKKTFSFGGGTPENYDHNIEATLRREMLEEVNTTLQNEVFYVGYQEIDPGDNTPPFAQVRMTALIKEIGPKLPDPDGGEIYDRLLTDPKKAIKFLNWKQTGKQQVERAVEVAKEKLGISFKNDGNDFWV